MQFTSHTIKKWIVVLASSRRGGALSKTYEEEEVPKWQNIWLWNSSNFTNFVPLKKKEHKWPFKKNINSHSHQKLFVSFCLKKKHRGQEGYHCPHRHWASLSPQTTVPHPRLAGHISSHVLLPLACSPCVLQGRPPGRLSQEPLLRSSCHTSSKRFSPLLACSRISGHRCFSCYGLTHSQCTSFQTWKAQLTYKGSKWTWLTH